jgi:hypothetical protein
LADQTLTNQTQPEILCSGIFQRLQNAKLTSAWPATSSSSACVWAPVSARLRRGKSARQAATRDYCCTSSVSAPLRRDKSVASGRCRNASGVASDVTRRIWRSWRS